MNEAAIWNRIDQHKEVLGDLDKRISLHAVDISRHDKEFNQLKETMNTHYGKIESSLAQLQGSIDEVRGEQSYRRGAINMLGWGIGLFCTVSSIAVAIWAISG